MATSYITSGMLLAAPAGISWTVVPTLTASTQDQVAQLDQVCLRVDGQLDTYCRQPLRAGIHTEAGDGPGLSRVSVDRDTGNGLLITRFSPVVQSLAVLVSPSRSFPEQWLRVPDGQFRPRQPVILSAVPTLETVRTGGNAVDVARGWFDWRYGRRGWRVQHSYLSGWPHTSLTAPAQPGDTQLAVDDVTGWNLGAGGWMYDGPATEQVTSTTASATVPAILPNGAGIVTAGPGTVTLAGPLGSAHPAGTVVSAMPTAVIQGAILLATVQALETIDAIATQSMSGQLAGGTGALATEAEMWLDDYRQIT